MKSRSLLAGIALVGILAGCGLKMPAAVAPLQVQGGEITGSVSENGAGNMVRLVQGTALEGTNGVDIAAGGAGMVRYYLEAGAAPELVADSRFLWRSTQGTGRLLLEELGLDGQVKRSVGWVYTGTWPAAGSEQRWVDARYRSNYEANWVEARYSVQRLWNEFFPGQPLSAAHRYRWVLEAGEGQHVLVSRFSLTAQPAAAVAVSAPQALAVRQGEEVHWRTRLQYNGSQPEVEITAAIAEPQGYGVTVQGDRVRHVRLTPGQTVELDWVLEGRRAERVNFGKPWQLQLSLNGEEKAQTAVSVAAARPGSVYYVMTEDLEPIDGAGYAKPWGNQDGWLNPEEYQVQMVQKAETLNAIAASHGAFWTHYIAWPAVAAAQWAQSQSPTKQWQEAVADIERSVRQESAKGHEYGVHMHTDYDPYIPGNVLSYYAAVDGLWANHLRHGWAHSLGSFGDYGNRGSRLGSLYAYQRLVDELAADSSQGQLLTARAGSFDFGASSESQDMSSEVFRRLGLWGSSDAAGNSGRETSAPYGGELYLAAKTDIGRPAREASEAGVVELRPTPQPPIFYDQQTAAVMNAKADAGMEAFVRNGAVVPGVHGIIGFTHAMFMQGEGDWRSLSGGQFAALDAHLAYLKQRYVQQGLLRFATASQLVRAFLDEEKLEATALYGKRLEHGWLSSRYEIELLGRDLSVSAERPQAVSVKIPLYLREQAFRAEVRKNGEMISSAWNLPNADNALAFVWDDPQATYTLTVYHQPWLRKAVAGLRLLKSFVRW